MKKTDQAQRQPYFKKSSLALYITVLCSASSVALADPVDVNPKSQTDNVVNVNGSAVTINGTESTNSEIKGIYGGYGGSAAVGTDGVTGNTLTVSNMNNNVSTNIYGGYVAGTGGDAAVSNNSTTVSSSSLTSNIYGGRGAGNVTGNSVTVDNVIMTKVDTTNMSIYGGYGTGAGDYEVSGNSVTLNGANTSIESSVYGGYSTSGSAMTNNRVVMNNGNVQTSVYGAYLAAGNGEITGNSVEINDGSVTGTVYGGYSKGIGALSNNTVTINGGTLNGNIYGAYSQSEGAITGNKVIVNGGTVNANIYGGNGNATSTGDITGNTVTLSGGTVNGNVYAGYTSNSQAVNNNTIELLGPVQFGESASLMGSSSATGTGNTLYFNSTAPISINKVGNFQTYQFYINEEVMENKADDEALLTVENTFSSGSTQSNSGIVGVSAKVNWEDIDGLLLINSPNNKGNLNTFFDEMNETTTTVQYGLTQQLEIGYTAGNGQLTANIIGDGYEYKPDDVLPENCETGGQCGTVASGPATGGELNIDSVAEGQSLYGGYSLTGDATNNTVTFENSGELSGIAFLYGGYSDAPGADVFTGNTLNFGSLSNTRTEDNGVYPAPITVGTLGNFENYNFYLSADAINLIQNEEDLATETGQEATVGLITVTNTFTNPDGATAESVSIKGISANADLSGLTGDYNQLVLIDASGAAVEGSDFDSFFEDAIEGSVYTTGVKYGLTQSVDINLMTDDQQLIAYIGDPTLKPGTNNDQGVPGPELIAPDELIRLRDLANGRIASIIQVSGATDLIANEVFYQLDRQPVKSVMPFLVVKHLHDQRYKTNTDSHMDVNETRLIFGTSYRFNEAWTAGVFFEYGHSNYDSSNAFVKGDTEGSGTNHYSGGGIIGRYTVPNRYVADDLLYFDGSLHMGNSHGHYQSNSIENAASATFVNYTTTSYYYGGHVNAGYIYPMNASNHLTSQVTLAHTLLKSDDIDIDGDSLYFKSSKSTQLKFTEKLHHNVNDFLTAYVGAAYEYEFSGEANTRISGVNIDGLSTKGTTYIGEIGFTIKPIDKEYVRLDFQAQAATGHRQGVAGLFSFRYLF